MGSKWEERLFFFFRWRFLPNAIINDTFAFLWLRYGSQSVTGHGLDWPLASTGVEFFHRNWLYKVKLCRASGLSLYPTALWRKFVEYLSSLVSVHVEFEFHFLTFSFYKIKTFGQKLLIDRSGRWGLTFNHPLFYPRSKDQKKGQTVINLKPRQLCISNEWFWIKAKGLPSLLLPQKVGGLGKVTLFR